MARFVRPRLAALEPRCLPAALLWTGSAGDHWDDPANWSGKTVPTAADEAVLDTVVTITGDHRVGRITATQTLLVTGGSLTLSEPGSRVADLRLVGGTVDGALTAEAFTWAGGTLAGSVVVSASASLEGRTKTLTGELRNQGVLLWSSGAVQGGGRLVNARGAALTVSAAPARLQPEFVNFGSLTVDTAGTLDADVVTQSGELLLRRGVVQADGFFQTEGTTRLDGGRLSSSETVVLSGGALTGTGSVAADVAVVAARLEPAEGGRIDVLGSLALGPSATVVLPVGVAPSSVMVLQDATLDGTLIVDVRGTADGAFAVLTARSIAGTFRNEVLSAEDGVRVDVVVGETEVNVETSPDDPEPPRPPDPEPDPEPEIDYDVTGNAIEGVSAAPVQRVTAPTTPVVLGVGAVPDGVGGLTALGGASGRTPAASDPGASRPVEPVVELTAPPPPEVPDAPPVASAEAASEELAAALLLGGRVALSGSGVAGVPTVESGDAPARAEGVGDGLSDLFLNPIGRIGGWAPVALFLAYRPGRKGGRYRQRRKGGE